MLDVPEPRVTGGQLSGIVLRVDRFGNLVTNIDRRSFEEFAAGSPIEIEVARHRVAGLVDAYAEAESGSACALFGSSDQLEIAIPGGGAAERFGLRRGAPVLVRLKADPTE
jgi:S-adenosyl-L-methionine hydrolase (adenosine-forming)